MNILLNLTGLLLIVITMVFLLLWITHCIMLKIEKRFTFSQFVKYIVFTFIDIILFIIGLCMFFYRNILFTL